MQPHSRHLCLLALVFASSPAGAASGGAFPNPDAFATELHRLQQEIHQGHASQVIAELPATWNVQTPGRAYVISTEQLRDTVETPDMAETWLAGLSDQVESYAAASQSSPDARSELNHILAGREFAAVKPPSPIELFWQSLRSWILDKIARLFSFIGADTTSGRVVFGIAAIIAIVLLETWLLGLWRGKRSAVTPTAQPVIPSRTWQKWALAAREAADSGDAREAVHCCYWAAVVSLQDNRLLPRDLTRTPREYLGLLRNGRTPAGTDVRIPLAALTGSMERIWYANRAPREGDVDESFGHLETLGCRL